MSTADTHGDAEKALFDRARQDRSGLKDEARLRAELDSAGFEAVVACSQVNVIYTSGVYLGVDAGRPTFMVTTASGERAAVVNEADEKFVAEYVPDVRAFPFDGKEAETAAVLLRDILEEFGLSRRKVGIEFGALSRSLFDFISNASPHVDWSDAKAVLQRARLIKTQDEIELLSAAALATDRAISQAFESSDRSTTEKTLAARIQSNALFAGADGFSHTNVNAGVHSTLGHVTSLENVINPGEVVYVDFGGKFAGYCTDLARNAVMGTPSATQADLYDRMFQIHLRVIDWLRPGITGGEVYERGQVEYEKAGLEYPWGTFGHSIGLDIHEGFEFSVGSDQVLEPSMVVCFELTHTEADARYHVEDMVLITDDGAEILSNADNATMRGITELD
jgi:Xaa-Pro aminopeptidase